MKVVRMNCFNGDSKTKAFFDIQTEEGFIITGFRVVDVGKGLFVAPRQEKGKDGRYYDTTVVPGELKKELEKIALEEFKKLI